MQALTTALAARGFVTTAAMPSDGGHVEARDFEGAGVTLLPLVSPPVSLYRRISELAGVIRRVDPGIVHAHGARAAFWARAALRLARVRGARLVYSVHGFATPYYPQPRRLVQSTIMRWVTSGASAVLACSQAERQALLQAGGAPPGRIHTIYYGMDLETLLALDGKDAADARESLGFAPQSWQVLMVCRMDIPRDFETLIEAFGRVTDRVPAAYLSIVGDGPCRPRVEGLIRRNGLQGHARVWGFRKDVARFYAAADLVTLTSWGWEGLPISIIEAQSAGLPVIVTDAGGSGEAIEPGMSGLLIPRRDPAALADALTRLATAPEAAAEMGRYGRERAASMFGLDTMVTSIEKLYESLPPV